MRITLEFTYLVLLLFTLVGGGGGGEQAHREALNRGSDGHQRNAHKHSPAKSNHLCQHYVPGAFLLPTRIMHFGLVSTDGWF